MLLRSGVQLRSRLRVSRVLWLRQREEGVVSDAAFAPTPRKAAEPAPVLEPTPQGPGTASELGLAAALLAQLVAKRPRFLAFVRARVPVADAEDLLQQALLRAASRLDSVRDGDRVDAWFYRLLRNAIADYHAECTRGEARLEDLVREAEAEPSVEASACRCSLGVLETLPAQYAAIVRRVDIDELSMAEIATELGISVNNAKVRLHRARISLREALLAFCGTSSVKACLTCGCD